MGITYHDQACVVIEFVNEHLPQVRVAHQTAAIVSDIAVGGEVKRRRHSITVHVGHMNPFQVPANGQGKERHLKDRHQELEQEESRVAVDVHQVFPAQGTDVEGAWQDGQWVSSALH